MNSKLSSRLKQLRFMQRAAEKVNANDSRQSTDVEDPSTSSTSQKACDYINKK